MRKPHPPAAMLASRPADPRRVLPTLRWLLLVVLLPALGCNTVETGGPVRSNIDLLAVDYGYPTGRFMFDSQQQPLEMAYMDVGPYTGGPRPDQVVDRLPVLLLHGKNFNGAYFRQTIERLSARGYRVIVPDQIGFGKSTKPAHYQYSFHQLADNTRRLLDDLGVDRVHVLGHSMGGMLAARLALEHPDRVASLTLLNPIGLEDWRRFGVPYQSVDDWYQRELSKTAEKIRAYQQESYYDGQWEPAYDRWVELLAAPIGTRDYPRLAWSQALTYDMIFTQPVIHEFGRLDVPTLLILGTRDRTALGKNLVEPDVAAEMGRYDRLGSAAVAELPDGKLIELEGLGHLPHIEAFDRFWNA